MRTTFRALSLRLTVAFLAIGCGLAAAQAPPKDLAEASLEDLLNVEVTTAARRQQPLSETAASVYVITREDIRRSGATNIPEALRLAPGVQVAQIDSHTWAISIRGFNYRYANKLLVLIDGRTVYTPAFSGVYWDLQDMALEDIERIEIIRGPGASLWGSNAVNGVINIITQRAADTKGAMVATGGGSRGNALAETRYGGSAAREALAYRIYEKYSRWGRAPDWQNPQNDAYDGGNRVQAGMRADWNPATADSLTFSGDLYRSSLQQSWTYPLLVPPFSATLNADINATGGNFLVRWQHQYDGGSQSALQSYYDRIDRRYPVFSLRQNTFDLDLQHQAQWGRRHELVFGAGYRKTLDRMGDSSVASFHPDQPPLSIVSGFVQDEILLVPKCLWLTLGSKFESNEYTGLQAQPSVRIRWQPRTRHTLWAAVSRAVRVPSHYEEIGRVNIVAVPFGSDQVLLTSVIGNKNVKAEQLLAYEVGYREQLARHLFVDLSTFYNMYRNLTYSTTAQPFLESTPAPPHLLFPLSFTSNVNGKTYGLEVSGTYAPVERWKLIASYSWLQMRIDVPSYVGAMAPGDNPQHQFGAHSDWSLPLNLEFDNSLYYTSALAAQAVPGYTRFDTRFGFRPTSHLELSLSLQNLLDPYHPEFVQSFDVQGRAQAARAIYGKATWRF